MRFSVDRARAVSIHAFRGEGDRSDAVIVAAGSVSIHAFRGEGDRTRLVRQRISSFQSTPSGGKATSDVIFNIRASGVSIHAFRGEGDRGGLR